MDGRAEACGDLQAQRPRPSTIVPSVYYNSHLETEFVIRSPGENLSVLRNHSESRTSV